MIKRFLHYLNPAMWVRSLSIYGNGRLWREVSLQAARSRWAEVAAAIAFLWLLGLLGLSFVLLHLELRYPLPQPILPLAHGLRTSLAIAMVDPNADGLKAWILGLVGMGAWGCLVGGSQKLLQLVAVAPSGAVRVVTWRTRLLPWGLTLLGLALAGLVLSLIGGTVSSQTGWTAGIWRLGRWAIALASVALGLAVIYRLAPRAWTPGLSLWPGIRLVLLLGLMGLGLQHWGLAWLNHQTVAYRSILALGLQLVTLYGLIVLVPMGSQVNLSALRHRRQDSRPWGSPPLTTPPPSFESFKINRRH
ncbi:hypothetical protein [Leptolyngbya sp. KIOST-1]|uniref:hypothetical protein n=1 Tax=Leptolyngbya sp. KIOST-1 TaxID=1229172 RepID=UPI00055D5313|nr:hypothetical protein [Leptolyngbya sp. KIOST-1]